MRFEILKKCPETVDAIQSIFKANSDYFIMVSGKESTDTASEEVFSMFPPNNSVEDKLVMGLYLQDQLIGMIEFLQNYPNSETIYLGLLLIDKTSRNSGYAKKLFSCAEDYIRKHFKFKTIRLGVFEKHDIIPFWEKMGFHLTSERKSIIDDHIEGYALIMEKNIIDI